MLYSSNSININYYKNFLEIASKKGFITAKRNGLCSKETVDFTFSKADYLFWNILLPHSFKKKLLLWEGL